MHQMSNRTKWMIFIAIFFVSLNLRPSVTSIGPLVNTIQEELGVSSTMMSLLTAIPVFCMGVFAPIAVPFQKKLGYRTSVNSLMILIGIATFARLYFNSFASLVFTSFLAGLSIAIISPIVNAYIKETFKKKMAPVIGIYSFAIGAGATLGAGLTGPIFESSSNWSLALAIWGLLAIIALLTWTLAVERKMDKAEQDLKNEDLCRNPWKSKLAWVIMIYFGLQTALFFSLTAWLPSIGQERGMSVITAGNVLTTMSIVQLVGNLTISSLISKYPNLIKWLYYLIGFGSIGALLLFIDANWSIWAGAIILGGALSGLFPIGLMLPLKESQNNSEANGWSSMVLSGGFMLSAIMPLVIGIVYDVTGSHFATKIIFILLFIFMWLSIACLKRVKKLYNEGV